MGSRFLIGGASSLEALQDGTFDATLNSLTIPNKTLNQPAVFDNGVLTERLLLPDDLNFAVLSNPFRGTLQVDDLETLSTFSLNGEIQKIDNFEASTAGNTNIDGTLNVDIIKVSEIYDSSDSSSLQFSNTSIGVLASTFNLNDNNITQVNDISANKFIVRGGTDIEYLMGDGSTLTQSANSGNSNFYLYTSINTSNAPPVASGNVEYNHPDQSLATIVYISHITRDNIDIEIFFQNVSTLNLLYLQDQNNSNNYIKYDITGNATIITNSYISIPVSAIESSGTGSSSFGTSHNILLSIFTNSIETDIRLSAVETKTQNITAISNLTTFAGDIATTGQESINTTLGYVSNFGWLLINNASLLASGSTISFIHKATTSYAITNKLYIIRNIKTYMTFVLPDLTGLPNAVYPNNYVGIGGIFGISLFRSGGILYLNFTYNYVGYNPTNYTWVAGDVIKIACDGTNIYYTLSGSNNINYTKSYNVGYSDYSQFICGFTGGNSIYSTNLTFSVLKFQITQQALECYDIIPTTNNTYDLGSTSNKFNNAYVNVLSSTSISSSGLNMNSNKITNVASPTISTDCANKNYVDTATGSIKNYANVGFNGNTITITPTANVFVSMNATFSSNITPIGFTLNPTGGSLTYTGTLTKKFHITFTGNAYGSNFATPNLYVYIRKNGSNMPGLQTNLSFPNSTTFWTQYSGNGIVSLSTNDIITTMIATTFGTATFLINQYSFSIIQID